MSVRDGATARDPVTDTVRVRGQPKQVASTVVRLKALLHEWEVIEA